VPRHVSVELIEPAERSSYGNIQQTGSAQTAQTSAEMSVLFTLLSCDSCEFRHITAAVGVAFYHSRLANNIKVQLYCCFIKNCGKIGKGSHRILSP